MWFQSQKELRLYFSGYLFTSYARDLGLNPSGALETEGKRRTPASHEKSPGAML